MARKDTIEVFQVQPGPGIDTEVWHWRVVSSNGDIKAQSATPTGFASSNGATADAQNVDNGQWEGLDVEVIPGIQSEDADEPVSAEAGAGVP